ncbi:pickpocket protein 28-like [Ochlerotatus camptorhynchus]|uniref:pickpocket protein 28-like n=1 Tax=Ochlerotatus camptorhynchus TaxID=644619 RepID=UPI0031D4D694
MASGTKRSVKRRNLKSHADHLLQEYCSNSSIHGVRYFKGQNQSRCERYWWVVVFALSVGSCAYLIGKIYQKWDQTPVIVSFHEKTIPIWKIPFPAVTICPRSKWNGNSLNFSKELQTLMREGPEFYNRTDDMLAILQLCDRTFVSLFLNIYNELPNKTTSESYHSLMSNISLPMETYFCTFRSELYACDHLLRTTFTEEGVCYTFNGLSSEDLLTDEVNPKFFEGNRSPHWTLEQGYSCEANLTSYPYRTIGPGALAGLQIMLYSEDKDLEYSCSGPVQGYKVLLHSPADYPQISNRYIHIPLDQEVMIAVKPLITETTHKLQHYSAERRQCFFSHDRSLRFFRVYTQDNCNLECLTNYTLQRCGCVRFSMIRTQDMPVCETNQMLCMIHAEAELLEMGVVEEDNKTSFYNKCNCMPACNSVDYEVEITQNEFEVVEWEVSLGGSRKQLDGTFAAHLRIYYKNSQFTPQKRSELYGLTDFLANCGGLLGLCLGVSLLSLVELFYFCSIRPFMLWKTRSQLPAKVENDSMPGISLLSTDIRKRNVWSS